MIGDHQAAVNGIFDFVKSRRVLSTGYIKEVHALITHHQHTWKARTDTAGKPEFP